MKIQRIISALLIASMALVACEKKSLFKEKDPTASQPNDFSFSTKQETDIRISYDVPQGYRVRFEAYFSNPLTLNEDKSYIRNTGLVPFLTGYTDENGQFEISAEIPAYAENIYVYSDCAGVPALLKGQITNSSVRISEIATVPVAPASKGSSGSNYKDWYEFSYTLQKPDLEKTGKEIDEKLLETINQTLPTNQDVVTRYYYEKITLREDANVTLYFVGNGLSDRRNALAYYVLLENESYDNVASVNQNLVLAFADLKGTNAGEGVKLVNPKNNNSKVFKKGTTIAFALLVDAYQNGDLKSPAHIAYSEKSLNSYTVIYDQGQTGSTTSRSTPHMGAFTTKDGQVLLSFEDQPYHDSFTKGADFRDEIFLLEANPVSSLPEDIKPGVDPDDDEPVYEYTITTTGILAFEDNWPRKGDYDMNDVMLSYTRTLNYREDYNVVSIDEEYTFLHNGADYTNSFGYQLGGNIKKENAKVTVTSAYNCSGQGLDPDMEKATVMLFDNGKTVPLNTTFKVYTVLKQPVGYSEFYRYPFNPFIVVNGDASGGYTNEGRTEVHLPKKYAPTAKADASLCGTEDDKSADGVYYIGTGNYPFAIELGLKPEDQKDFGIPTEKKAIDATYPRFINWVKSNGEEDTDWYIHK